MIKPEHQRVLEEFNKLTAPSPCTIFVSRLDDDHIMIRKQDYRFVFNEEQTSQKEAQITLLKFLYNGGFTHEEIGLVLDVLQENNR